jgi:protein-arginine deiminase
VPSGVGTPYRVLLPSPRLAVELLTKAEKDAPGGILNRGTKRDQDKPNEFERPVAAALADQALMDEQQLFQKKLDALRATLKRDLGVKDEDVVELPVLFHVSMKSYAGRAVAETPSLVNGLLVNGTYIVPDPHGPLVNGKDAFLEDVKRKLEPLGVAVKAIDDFHPYHRWLGDVHCATNATRRPFQGKK